MVKSFQGVRMVEAKKSPAAQILVKDHMSTNLVTFNPDDTIEDEYVQFVLDLASGQVCC